MPLQKSALPINFLKGLDLKSDPWQIAPGQFLELENTVFEKLGGLDKRNGFGLLTSVAADADSHTLATFSDGLLAIGSRIQALNPDGLAWIDKGPITNIELSVQSMVRSASGQATADVAVSSSGSACAVFLNPAGNAFYQIVDSNNGQTLIAATPIVGLSSAAGKMPRVFILKDFFIITFLCSTNHIEFIAVPIAMPSSPRPAALFASTASSVAAGYDGVVYADILYVAWDSLTGGQNVKISSMDSSLVPSAVTTLDTGHQAARIALAADTSTNDVWAVFSDGTDIWAAAVSQNFGTILATTYISTPAAAVEALAITAQSGAVKIFAQIHIVYPSTSIRSDLIASATCTRTGTVTIASAPVKRGVALASKAFLNDTQSYMMVVYGGTLEPTYFLMDDQGTLTVKIANANASGYPINQILPQANATDTNVSIGYLFKDLVRSINKDISGVGANVYTQNGINLAQLQFDSTINNQSEVGGSLHLTGGFLWQYDGARAVEHGFHLWPEDITATPGIAGGGAMALRQYYYQVTYEWTDAQGMLHRSAPSLPISALVGGSNNSVALQIPTLRATAKSDVTIVVYRWSVAQPVFYQVTSYTSPLLNDTTVDTVTYTDKLADASILGNTILYTVGGTVENIGAPAASSMALFKTRLFLVDAEDPNLLWYSKQVIEATPVEMSNLFTIFIAPTISAQGSTGPITAVSAMDDKLIVFKRNAIYYIVGTGPDNTGANNDFSDPVFITSTAGCTDPHSIVLTPMGLMFKSDKGIWLLGRDLSTTYIGAPVENFNSSSVLSALTIPGVNQVRFTLDNGVTLMYDYFFQQWGTFTGIPGISSVLYQNKHTFLNKSALIQQETEGKYLDGTRPVAISFKTGWFNLAGLQGYERAYMVYLLGRYLSPHKLSVEIAYDYEDSPEQTILLPPDNQNPYYGGDTVYGAGVYGGSSQVEQWRIFLKRQRCQAFQLKVTEIFDPSFGQPVGAGIHLSGLNLVVGAKKAYTPMAAKRSIGR